MNVFYFVLLAFLLGTGFAGVAYSTDALGPYIFAFLRMFIGFIFFWLCFVITKKSVYLPRKEAWRPWLAGFLTMGLPFIFIYWCLRFMPSGADILFNGTVPFLVFIIAAFTLKGADSFTWRKAAGVIAGFGGLLCIMWPSVHNISGAMGSMPLSSGIALLALAVLYAVGCVLNKAIFKRDITLEQNIFHQYLFSMIFLLFAALLSGLQMPGKELLRPGLIFSVLYVSIFSTAVALLLLLKLIKDWGALKASAVVYLIPVVTVSGAFLLNGRMPRALEVVGAVLVIGALLLMRNRKESK